MKKTSIIGAAVIFFFGMAVSLAMAQQKEPDGKTVFEKTCGTCHGLSKAQAKKKTSQEWQATVTRMKQNGAKFSDEDGKLIVDYLAKTYPK